MAKRKESREEMLQSLPQPARKFWQAAFAYMGADLNREWQEIVHDSEEFHAWAGWFRSRGWTPSIVRYLHQLKRTGEVGHMFMPTRIPTDFEVFHERFRA